jgi:hypothetical protein
VEFFFSRSPSFFFAFSVRSLGAACLRFHLGLARRASNEAGKVIVTGYERKYRSPHENQKKILVLKIYLFSNWWLHRPICFNKYLYSFRNENHYVFGQFKRYIVVQPLTTRFFSVGSERRARETTTLLTHVCHGVKLSSFVFHLIILVILRAYSREPRGVI